MGKARGKVEERGERVERSTKGKEQIDAQKRFERKSLWIYTQLYRTRVFGSTYECGGATS